uniref:Uncharacterized protein n=1 Tax=Pithovirus LCPAC101 TaxID=2506586 RepID=A0A481Z2V8_9VIRU|nr:MAG: hypothetical protein LCPAC101_01080 [Pithovirus LCPAC101]
MAISFFSGNGNLVNGINYDIVELNSSSSNVTLKTGANSLGISAPSADKTVTILANTLNKPGLTIAIKNNSSNTSKITVAEGSGVSIDDGQLGLDIEAGQTAEFVAVSNSSAFLRLT